MEWFGYLLAVAAGALNAVQSGMNAQLRKALDQPILALFMVYIIGLVGVLIGFLFDRPQWPGWDKVTETPWWAWLGGLVSIVSTVAALTYAKKLGSAAFTGCTVTASLVCSVLLDHMGWVGFEVHPAGLWRIVGLALMVTGLMLVAKF